MCYIAGQLLSFGLKVDACPGRLNQLNLFIKRVGVFLGHVVKFVGKSWVYANCCCGFT